MREEEEGIWKELCEMVKKYMRWSRKLKKNNLNYSNIKLTFKSLIYIYYIVIIIFDLYFIIF